MRHIAIFAAMIAAMAPSQPTWAGMADDCNQNSNMDRRIIGCTAVIRSGDYSGVDLAAAYSNRGIAYSSLGEYGRAIEDYDEALRIDPKHRNAYNNRGVSYDNLGDYHQAIKNFDEALRIDPGYAVVYNNRGNSYDDLGEYRRAILDYDKALRIKPDYPAAYQNRGVSYESLGQYDRAVSDWEMAIRLEGESRAIWWQKYLKGKGHYPGAIDGIFGPVSRRGLAACAVDPSC